MIQGTHDIDKKWMSDVRKSAPGLKVIPRVLFDKWTGQDYINLFRDGWRVDAIAKLITKTVTKQGFDGVVLEVWSQLGGQAKPQLTSVVKAIGKALRAKDKARTSFCHAQFAQLWWYHALYETSSFVKSSFVFEKQTLCDWLLSL